MIILIPTTMFIFKIELLVTPFQTQIWIQNRGCFLFQDDHFEYQQPYVNFKIEHFIPYICFSQYYLIYVLSINWALLIVLKKLELLFDVVELLVHSLFLFNSIFYCESVGLNFFMCMLDICWRIFVNHLAFLSPCEYQSGHIFLRRSTPDLVDPIWVATVWA